MQKIHSWLIKSDLCACIELYVIDFNQFYRYTGAFTMDVIARTAFGIEIDSQLNKDNPFVVHAHKTMNQNFFRPAVLIACKQ